MLIVLYTSMNLPIAVWMMRSFLTEVPVEILEAASMDGVGLIRTLRQVVAPVIMPGIAATSLICSICSWSELLVARVLTGTVAQTASVYLTSFVTSQGLFLAQARAAAIVVSLPVDVMMSHRIPLEDYPRALEQFKAGVGRKIVVEPGAAPR